jgi:hypothetical protein
MIDDKAIVKCDNAARIVGTINALMPQLPPKLRSELNEIKIIYLQYFGVEGLFNRMNNKSIASIILDFSESKIPPLNVVTSGEMDGITYTVFDSPDNEQQKDAK